MKNNFFLFCLFISTLANSQENCDCGVIYGENHSFKLIAPSGWVLDNKSGVSQGIHAVFYKKGESWANAETVMCQYSSIKNIKTKNFKTAYGI